MYSFLQFMIILIAIISSGIFGGLKIKDFIQNREAEESKNYLIVGALYIFGGLIVAIGSFLLFP